MEYIELETYRRKGINAYLVNWEDGKPDRQYLYGEPVPGQEELAHKGKRHTVRVRIDNLEDGEYRYKEAGGADGNKPRTGGFILKDGEIIKEWAGHRR